MHLPLQFVAAVLFPVMCNAVFANEFPSQTELLDLSLKELLEISVSSATLTPLELKQAPASISVLTRSQLRLMPYRYVHEIMNHIPGFQSFRQAEAGDEYYHSVRGRRVGTSSREVLVLLDGVRVNRESDGAVAIPSLLLENIESIEFIRGPGSALYGSNAFMGVVSITSRKAGRRIVVSGGENGRVTAAGGADFNLGEWQGYVYAAIENDAGQRYVIENNFSHNQQSSKDPTSKKDISIRVAADNTEVLLGSYDRQAEQYYVIEFVGDSNKTRNQFQYATLKSQFEISSSWSLDLSANVAKAQYRAYSELAPAGFAEAYGGSQPDSDEPYKNRGEQVERTLSVTALNNWALSESSSVQLGGELRQARTDALFLSANFDLNSSPIAYSGGGYDYSQMIAQAAEINVLGAFIQYQSRVTNRLHIVLGGRYDDYNSEGGSQFSPRGAVVWTPNSIHTLKASCGEAFRSPTANEKHFTSNNVVLGNRQLRAERLNATELSWLADFDRWNASVGVYDIHVKDGINQSFIAATRTFVNSAEEEHFHGVELEMNWAPSAAWKVSANMSLLSKADGAQFRQADRLGSIRLDYVADKWNWNLSTSYAGRRRMSVNDQYIELPSYGLVSSVIQWQLQADHEIALGINNLLNEHYQTPTQGNGLTQGVPNRRREVSLTYRYRF